MDPYLAIASKRDERTYADTPVPDEVRERILDAGRLSGSSQNRQRWEFVLVSGTARERLAIVGEAGGMDVGRCAQNMMIAAWGDGVTSCPNGVRDADAAEEICGGDVRTILSFGYPARPRDVESRSAEEWSVRANRKPLSELVREVG